ncbi:hypothetical protein [Emcibacter sp.]|uniref:hypothetical protein n=1 Tax=Emcibacter sp. TaxID=1979954 RepID=UPI002AA8BC02|nr:hypothetical protein [Emcibacter sp.]
MTMRKEARLTGSLLARKGRAIPSPSSPKFSAPAINRFEHIEQGNTAEVKPEAGKSESPLENTIGTVRKLAEIQGKKVSPTDEKTTSMASKIFGRRKKVDAGTKASKAAAGKRVAMTLRMNEEDHLKLRLYSAHTRMSCQEVLTEALDMYLSHQSEDMNAKKCSCLAE